jgi:hypothetical protein
VSNVIDFLERMGRDATLREAAAVDLAEVLSASALDEETRAALLRQDRRGLEAILGVQGNVCCLVHAPDDDEPDEDDEPVEPDDEDEVRSHRQATPRAVGGN